ncbi:MAG: PHP domain-containing protein [Victivallales bacterium]|nr:PHP domain-containing protein [Victivallales bacterium]MCF7889448.1 PHP domain-containing protein [Victivallales bacterium]
MIDLHIHSTASDGTDSPAKIIDKSIDLNLYAIALTDHDTVSGIDEFLNNVATKNIIGIPGVEIAMLWKNREYHILGYWIDHKNRRLLDLLQLIRDNRKSRNHKIISKLNNNGLNINLEEILQKAKGESVGRPHIASVLVEKGYFPTIKDVFSTCLATGGTGYVPRILPTPEEAINTIKEAGGIAIWAHPFHRGKAGNNFQENLEYFIKLGLAGIEAYYPEFSQNQHNKAIQAASDNGLTLSGGTDYHGSNQPGINLGTGRGNLQIPNKVYDKLLDYYSKS